MSSPTASSSSKTTATPVIRVLTVAEEARAIVWRRRVRALIASGVIHTVAISVFILFCRTLAGKDAVARTREAANTIISAPEEEQQAQVEFKMDFDLDSSLAAVAEPVEVDEFRVEAPVVDAEPPGLPDHKETFATPSSNLGLLPNNLQDFGTMHKEELEGLLRSPNSGGGGDLDRPGRFGNSGLPADVQRRLSQAGGKTGQIQITLVWNNLNDLDLHCVDPNGEVIFYGNRRAVRGSGGHLDVDRNVDGETMKPVENIYFPQGKTQPGKYRVFVDHYRNNGSRDPTPFRVYIKVNGRYFNFGGSIASGQPTRLIYEFTLAAK